MMHEVARASRGGIAHVLRYTQFLVLLLSLIFTATHVTSSEVANHGNIIFRVVGETPTDGPEAYRTAHFLYYADGKGYNFPDQHTYESILHDLHFNVTYFPNAVAKMILKTKIQPLLPSLVPKSANWDEHLRVKITRSMILERNDFVDMKSIIHIPKVNPSFIFFNKRILLCWRENNKVAFGWFDADNKGLDESIQYLGVGGERKFPIAFNRSQEDPRMIRLSDHSILITFVATEVVGPNKVQGTYCYTFARYDKTLKELVFSDVVTFDNELDTQQKNWIPFEYNQTIHFYHTIHPYPRIMKLLGHSLDHIAVTEDIRMNQFYLPNHGLFQHPNKRMKVDIPWKMKFGEVLHGGTPAIQVTPQLYLFFFHTTDFRQHPWNIFMGAATFCANNINIMHSISTHPIMKPEFYHGRPYNKRVAYIVFPMGLEVNLYSKEYVTLSMGMQDPFYQRTTYSQIRRR